MYARSVISIKPFTYICLVFVHVCRLLYAPVTMIKLHADEYRFFNKITVRCKQCEQKMTTAAFYKYDKEGQCISFGVLQLSVVNVPERVDIH